MNLNNVCFSGRLVKSPELKELTNDKKTKVVNFSLAQNIKVKGGEDAVFINCVAYDKIAENVTRVEKGSEVIIEGRLNQNKWIDATTNENKQYLEIIVHKVHYFPLKNTSSQEIQLAEEKGAADGQ